MSDHTNQDEISSSRSRSNIKFDFGDGIPEATQNYIRSRLKNFDNSRPMKPRAFYEGAWVDLHKYQTDVEILFQNMTFTGDWIWPASMQWRESLVGTAHLMTGDLPILQYTDWSQPDDQTSKGRQYSISSAAYRDVPISVGEEYQNSGFMETPEALPGEGFSGSPIRLFMTEDDAEEFLDKKITPFVGFSQKSKPISEAYEAGMRYTWPEITLSSPAGKMFSDHYSGKGFGGNAICLPNHVYDAVKQNLAQFKRGVRLKLVARMELWGINVTTDMTCFEEYASLSLVPLDCQLTGGLRAVEMYWDDGGPPFNNPSPV